MTSDKIHKANELAPPAEGELNEFEAAALVGMSPKLLRWLSRYAPKQDIDRKLKVRKDGEGFFVLREELVEFNDWMRLPWPNKGAPRPTIPAGIRDEIRIEAGGDCAICKSNAGSCEAAHIDPVHKSKNNHPENLIWLCANHHTKFDKGHYGPLQDDAEFVVSFKKALAYGQRRAWDLQAKVTGRLYSALKVCESLDKQLTAAKTTEQVAAVEGLAKVLLAQVPTMAPKSKADPDYAAFEAMKPQFDDLAKSAIKPKNIPAALQLATTVKTAFARRLGYEACPLCKGRGHYNHEDCPACGGDGELTAAQIRAIDFDRFAEVDCPLCKGAGTFKTEDCPACQGDGQIERRFADQIDPREWDDVDCPLCAGSGKHKGEDCPACGGDGEMERHFRDRIDLSDYEDVDCPLCKGKGTYQGEDCPECRGERRMERRFADQVDLSSYKMMKCFICEGSGEFYGTDCPACGGQGEFPRWHGERIDRYDYKLVDCPTCENKARDRTHCISCNGEGRMPRLFAERIGND